MGCGTLVPVAALQQFEVELVRVTDPEAETGPVLQSADDRDTRTTCPFSNKNIKININMYNIAPYILKYNSF